ncbi:tetratricopeptide repeat protein [Consotaella aegiceratis]|uniref:tetratricopeptide repeat protein n=1 Tax=Consotaella aegiceratis TaxID=3097961 RepID=UPI002F3E9B09
MSCRVAALCVVLSITIYPVEGVMAEPTFVAIEVEGAPADDAGLRERVARMRGYLDDEDARFDAIAAVSELTELRAYAGDRSGLLAERREILSMIGSVVSRSATIPFEDGLEPLAEIMTLEAGDDRPVKRRMFDHYAYAELASDYATLPGHGASHDLAAEQYGKAAALADQLDGFDDNQRAGMRQKQAYELHEAGRYDEALSLNQGVLETGERLFGPNDPQLITVLTNIAQNLHALGRKPAAEPYLVRVQTIAEAEGDLETVQDMLFQRGVLSYELGRFDEARSFMRDRIDRLRTADETELLATAMEDYEELERRIGGQ